MRSIRSGRGIGDNLYLQSIVRHYAQSERLAVCTDWPEIFRPLRDKVELFPFRRLDVDLVSHYVARKNVDGTDQFHDCCISAGLVHEPVELMLDWEIEERHSVLGGVSSAKPVVLVQMPRQPFDRVDGYGRDLLPNCRRIQDAIDEIGDRALIVQIGKGEPIYKFSGIDVDLSNRTTVGQMIDVASVASAFLGYCSFMVPLAESFSARALFVWSRLGISSRTPYIRTITPKKILHRASSRYVFDDCSDEELIGEVDALLDEAGSKRAFCREIGCDSRERAFGSG